MMSMSTSVSKKDGRPWWRWCLALMRAVVGIAAHDRHAFFIEDGSSCWRAYVLWGRWEIARRTTCHSTDAPHERALEHELPYRSGLSFRIVVSYVRLALASIVVMAVLALSFRAWQRLYVFRDLPGANGEPLPRDWRAPRTP